MNKGHPSHPVYGDAGSSPRKAKQASNAKNKRIKQYNKLEGEPSASKSGGMDASMSAEGYMAPPTESGGSLTVPPVR